MPAVSQANLLNPSGGEETRKIEIQIFQIRDLQKKYLFLTILIIF